MLKSNFQNYTGLFDRGTYLNRELLALVEHAEMHPQTATPTPANASGTTTWASSDPAVATVSASGLVTGVSAGTATITATRGGKTDTCAVAVTEA